jgi:hypothetical protein
MVSDVAAVAAALALTLAVPLGSVLRGWSARRKHSIHSLAAGISLAYVLLDLLVELTTGSDAIHAVLPVGPDALRTLFAVVLVGTTLSYAGFTLATRVHGTKAGLRVALVPRLVYGVFVGGAMDLEAEHGTKSLLLFEVAMLVHLAVIHSHLELDLGSWRGRAARAFLALAPALGALAWTSLGLPQAGLFLSLALVAGSTFTQVFQYELPSPADARVGPFVLGVVLYAGLVVVRWAG